MAIKSYKLGPGTLTLSTAGGASVVNVEAQVRSMTVKVVEKVKAVDPIPVLSGEELEGDESVTFDYTLVGNILQDIESDGLTDWTWAHKAEVVAFDFAPTTAGGNLTCSGEVSVVPVDFGGDVDKAKRAEAAINWRIKGTPTLL